MNAEGRERFFRAIAERIDVERVEEVHVFPAIRQGGRESGVAVLTLRPLPAESEAANDIDATGAVDARDDAAAADALDATVVAESADAVAEGEVDWLAPDAARTEGEEVADAADAADERAASPPPPPQRFTVLRAQYRLQLKGPDRGKWEVTVVEEADAPAATVSEVVRGVHERAGGWSVEGPERLTGDEFRAALVEEPWNATR